MSLNGSRTEQVQASLQRIVAPAKEDVERFEAEITEIEQAIEEFIESKREDLTELKQARRKAIQIIRIAEPNYRKSEPKQKKAGRTSSSTAIERVRDRIEQLMKEGGGADADEGVTQTWLNRELTGASPHTIRPALDQLLEQGIIRVDRKTKGGGVAYALIEQ